jgi:hypothetical protein
MGDIEPLPCTRGNDVNSFQSRQRGLPSSRDFEGIAMAEVTTTAKFAIVPPWAAVLTTPPSRKFATRRQRSPDNALFYRCAGGDDRFVEFQEPSEDLSAAPVR